VYILKEKMLLTIIMILLLNFIALAANVIPMWSKDFSGWLYYVGQEGEPHDQGPYCANYYIVEFEWVVPWPSYDSVWLLIRFLDINGNPIKGSERLFNQNYQRTFIFNLEDFGHYLQIVYYYWNGLGEAPEVYYAGYVERPKA